MAVIADIHANLEALEAVLADIAAASDIDLIVCCGDLVDYGPNPNEGVERVFTEKIPCIMGNHDRAVAHPLPLEEHKTAPGRDRAVELACLDWTRRRCTARTRELLATLPASLHLDVGGGGILALHATPESIDTYLWPDDSDGWESLHQSTGEYDLVLLGHTHLPIVRRLGRTLYVNPGSVGKPKGGDPRANYAVIDLVRLASDHPTVEPRKVAYNAEKTAAKMRRFGLPDVIVEAVRRGVF